MTHDIGTGCSLGALVHDPLIRLVMASDGVSERDLLGLMIRVRRAIRAREGGAAPAVPLAAVQAAAVRAPDAGARFG